MNGLIQEIEHMNVGAYLMFNRKRLYDCLSAIQFLNKKYAYGSSVSSLDRHWAIDTMKDMRTTERSIYVVRKW